MLTKQAGGATFRLEALGYGIEGALVWVGDCPELSCSSLKRTPINQ